MTDEEEFLHGQIDELEYQIEGLNDQIKDLIYERDEWQSKTEDAEYILDQIRGLL